MRVSAPPSLQRPRTTITPPNHPTKGNPPLAPPSHQAGTTLTQIPHLSKLKGPHKRHPLAQPIGHPTNGTPGRPSPWTLAVRSNESSKTGPMSLSHPVERAVIHTAAARSPPWLATGEPDRTNAEPEHDLIPIKRGIPHPCVTPSVQLAALHACIRSTSQSFTWQAPRPCCRLQDPRRPRLRRVRRTRTPCRLLKNCGPSRSGPSGPGPSTCCEYTWGRRCCRRLWQRQGRGTVRLVCRG